MTLFSGTCPICGAKITRARSHGAYHCIFCGFECRAAPILGATPVQRYHSDGRAYDTSLPFQEDLALFFREKFNLLKPGDTLYLSTPVTRLWRKTSPLAQQINFFHAKNIMFLLEQHGFKMVWRENRFSTTLNIIARRS